MRIIPDRIELNRTDFGGNMVDGVEMIFEQRVQCILRRRIPDLEMKVRTSRTPGVAAKCYQLLAPDSEFFCRHFQVNGKRFTAVLFLFYIFFQVIPEPEQMTVKRGCVVGMADIERMSISARRNNDP